ncbi:MAG: purine-binding chemotaxis protein CheW [Frankiaceae bacterium]|jgi:chemotaxis signal transduction protein|nr:purine-binding chemotaxis protein CheW [Frankiaceae bacterium]
MSEYVTFRLGDRDFATSIAFVREVVRLTELLTLPGMTPPLAGVLDLRGVSLPVVDIRPAPGGPGDVLVLHDGERAYGFACDAVSAVVGHDALVAETSSAEALPDYVEAVLRGSAGPVFLVDVRRMAGGLPVTA